jgi:hypothetical protein
MNLLPVVWSNPAKAQGSNRPELFFMQSISFFNPVSAVKRLSIFAGIS